MGYSTEVTLRRKVDVRKSNEGICLQCFLLRGEIYIPCLEDKYPYFMCMILKNIFM